MSTPTVREMVAAALRAQGFDGLYTNECACLIDDLMPCDLAVMACHAGYKVPCPRDEECGCDLGDCEWHVMAEKPTTENGCPGADNRKGLTEAR